MLAPSFEALDGSETFLEGLEDHLGEFIGIRDELDPVVLNVGSDFTELLDDHIICIFIFLSI